MDQPWQQVLDEILGMKMHMELLAQGQRQLQASFDELKSRAKSGDHGKAQSQKKHDVVVTCDTTDKKLAKDLAVPSYSEGPKFETVPRLARPPSVVLPDHNRSQEMAEDSLKKILQVNKENEALEQKRSRQAMQHFKGVRLFKSLISLDAQEMEFAFDSIIAQVILLNAIFIGFSLDYEDGSPGWVVVQFIFALLFWSELLLKLKLHGCKRWYCGMSGKHGIEKSNIFDTCIVLADSLQLVLELGPKEWGEGMLDELPISIFRLVRLIRLTRVLRLLRSNVFKDLFNMVQGLTCGIGTLGWAVVVFLLFIYLVALMCKEMLGSVDDRQTMESFNSVPQSMFTVFRCSFGDCSSADGMPLFVSNGPLLGVLYSFFTFVVVVGIFNVISAIFVESTLESAKVLTHEKLQARLDNPTIWSVNVTKVLKALLLKQCIDVDELAGFEQGKCSDEFTEKLFTAEFPRDLFDEVVKENDDVKEALSALDINSEENAHLSDLLDPDNGGSVGCLELVDGLNRLRGEPRRGDIIAVDLMIRSLQEKVDQIWYNMKEIKSKCVKAAKSIEVDNPSANPENASDTLSDSFWFVFGE